MLDVLTVQRVESKVVWRMSYAGTRGHEARQAQRCIESISVAQICDVKPTLQARPIKTHSRYFRTYPQMLQLVLQHVDATLPCLPQKVVHLGHLLCAVFSKQAQTRGGRKKRTRLCSRSVRLVVAALDTTPPRFVAFLCL